MVNKIADRFSFENPEDIYWFIGLFVGSLITCLSLFTFTLVIQHLHCIPRDPQARTQIIEPPFTKIYSTLSAIFATISVVLIFTTYPICTQYVCGYDALGNFYYVTILDSYIAAKLFLYFLFIGRLFNENYGKIYKYPVYIKYFLFIVIFIVIATTIITNVGSVFNFHHQSLNNMIIVWVAIYTVADFILSGCTLILFFRPLWSKTALQSLGALTQSPSASATGSASGMSVVLKYGIISALQTITAMLYGISLIVRFVFGWFHTTNEEGDSYLDICSLIQMMDMLTTMLAIYLGFAKKQTYQQYCEICERYWITCCCNCCSGYQLSMYHDINWNKHILKQQLVANGIVDTTINTSTVPTTNNATTTSISVNDCSMDVIND